MAFFDISIEYVKGIGPQRAEVLTSELGISTYGELLMHYPFRHEDRSRTYTISELTEATPAVPLVGEIRYWEELGSGPKKRLVAYFFDQTGELELVWFKGVAYFKKTIQKGVPYRIFGKASWFNGGWSMTHPELEPDTEEEAEARLMPVYSTTEKLKRKGVDSRTLARAIRHLLEKAHAKIPESLPEQIIAQYKFLSKADAVAQLHFPSSTLMLERAQARLKFEELFYIQLKQLSLRQFRTSRYPGQTFTKLDSLHRFYKELLPFDLTEAQKRVIREIYHDLRSGQQMNRLLQGDVGSGKTIVAFISMLMAIDNGAQACMMAPTEILVEQHYNGLKPFADALGLEIRKLTGSSKVAERRLVDKQLKDGSLKIIVGTHALLEDKVDFQNLGLCVIDEQHRFGVAQRAKLWHKTSQSYPHVLVMTATPIPRTLAMTLYGDLAVSTIDELPAGRKPIQTFHYTDAQRLRVWGFLKKEIAKGRQAYIVYPLIEESETLEYKNLMDGYESVCRNFPDMQVSIVHGKMKPEAKDYEMQRFIKKETQLMVATTVIEVGVNVPNASVMVIENAEKFGLAQLHQLRGRVGRGPEQSYCILMTGQKLSKEAKIRLETMTRTNNGFEIADVDLKMRGPGDMAGTQQSGVLDLRHADLAKDQGILAEARTLAGQILQDDPMLDQPKYAVLKRRLAYFEQEANNWSRIS